MVVASERVERLREVVDIWNRGDIDGLLDALGPGFELTPDPSFPDGRPMTGDEFRGWMHQWAETWPENELELLELEDHGGAATARARWHLRAADSKLEIPVADFTFVVWFDAEDRPARCAAAPRVRGELAPRAQATDQARLLEHGRLGPELDVADAIAADLRADGLRGGGADQ